MKSLLKYCVLCAGALTSTSCFASNQQPSNNNQSNTVSAVGASHFYVLANRLVSANYDTATAEADNKHLLSALETAGIDISSYDYKVDITQKKIHLNYDELDENVNINRYTIRFLNFDAVRAQKLFRLEHKDYIETYISIVKAPTKCYVFISNQALNLICKSGVYGIPNLEQYFPID